MLDLPGSYHLSQQIAWNAWSSMCVELSCRHKYLNTYPQPTDRFSEQNFTRIYQIIFIFGVALYIDSPWWRHQMEAFSALLALCEGNPPVTSGFPSHRLVTRNFDVFFDLLLDQRLHKHSRHRWLKTPSRWLWRHSNDTTCLWILAVVIYIYQLRSNHRCIYTYTNAHADIRTYGRTDTRSRNNTSFRIAVTICTLSLGQSGCHFAEDISKWIW